MIDRYNHDYHFSEFYGKYKCLGLNKYKNGEWCKYEDIKPLIDSVLKLKNILSNDGEYSIHRTDTKPMDLPQVIMIGDLLEGIDKYLEE